MGFFDIVRWPRKTMESEIEKADLNAAIKTYAIYAAIIGFLLGLVIALIAGMVGAFAGQGLQQIPGASFIVTLGLAAIIVVPILAVIWMVISTIIGWGIIWLIAKLLGGTGTFTQTYFLASRLVWPLFIIGIILGILSIIPILGLIILLVWFLYQIYLFVVMISVANKISNIKALVTLISPFIILAILLILLFGSLFAFGSTGLP